MARLAVDFKYQGQKIGHGLLTWIILEASRTIGVRAVLVQAKDQRAANFYARYGFVPSPIEPLHWMLLIKDIVKSIQL